MLQDIHLLSTSTRPRPIDAPPPLPPNQVQQSPGMAAGLSRAKFAFPAAATDRQLLGQSKCIEPGQHNLQLQLLGISRLMRKSWNMQIVKVVSMRVCMHMRPSSVN